MTDLQKQCLLKYLGYYQGAVDGIFGGATEASVRQFQEIFNLRLLLSGKASLSCVSPQHRNGNV